MLPHRIDTLGSPVTIPPQKGENDITSLERGFRAGKARDPAQVRAIGPVKPQTVLTVPTKPAPAVRLPGDPRPPHHPTPGAASAEVRVWGTGEWDQVNTGAHGEFSPLAGTPQGEQQRVSVTHGNSFRLPPQPWDAAQVVGWQGAE